MTYAAFSGATAVRGASSGSAATSAASASTSTVRTPSAGNRPLSEACATSSDAPESASMYASRSAG